MSAREQRYAVYHRAPGNQRWYLVRGVFVDAVRVGLARVKAYDQLRGRAHELRGGFDNIGVYPCAIGETPAELRVWVELT